MKKSTWIPWLVFLGSVTLGVLLHFLYGWFPSPFTALFSPVRESLWEHLKILYWPLLVLALVLGRGSPSLRAVRLLAIPVVAVLMLSVSWLYHIALRGERMAFDLILYGVLMLLGFLLPRCFWHLGEWPGTVRLAVVTTAMLGGLLVWFTFSPPDNVLFADLGEGVRTFFTIPV